MKRILFLLFMFVSTTLTLFAQELQIKGIVLDARDQFPMIGVNVIQKGTTNGATTDLDGNFALRVPKDAIITISYVGYKPIEFKAADEEPVTITLIEDSQLLDDVVVIGYGVQKKSVVTAAIGQVSAEDLKNVTPTRVDNILKGQTSGVTVTQASGQPGEGSKVSIRGIGTINNSNPLYIVDGMQVDGGIDYLSPADIESIEILKDGASAAVYGTRGANGVILVTTKSGKKGKAVVTYDFSYGLQNAWKKRDMLDASEYMMMMNEMNLNSGKAPIYANPALGGVGTDWQDELFYSNAPVMNNQASVSGGSDNGSYFFSVGHFKQDGIIGGDYDRSNYERLNLRTNLKYDIFDQSEARDFVRKMTFGANVGYTRTKSTGISTNSEFGSPLGSALLLSPLESVYAQDPEGTLAKHPTAVKDKDGNVYTIVGDQYNEITNPLAQLSLPGGQGHSDKIIASFWGEIELYKNLKFKTTYGADLSFWGSDSWTPAYYLGKSNNKAVSEVYSSMNRAYNWQLENVLTYNNTIGDHSFGVLLGQSAKRNSGRSLWGSNVNLQEEDGDKANLDFALGTKVDQASGGSAYSPSAMASLFARADYNYKERYMAQVTVRRDGSSNFGPNNRYAVFPSFSLGWNVTNESFLENKPDWLTSIKLRYSWGKNGNDQIEAFRYTTTMVSGNNYIFGQTKPGMVVGAKPNGLENADLQWEESLQSDLGLDLGFFNNALTFTADYFVKSTNGMLMQIPLPSYVGDTPPLGNVGDMENKGFEMDLGYRFEYAGIDFNVSANATYLKNTLINLGNAEGFQNYDHMAGIGTITRAENGESFPFFYGKKTDGIFQTQEEIDSYVNAAGEKIQPNAVPGDVRFVDYNEDGKIDDEDRTKIGKGMPDWTFGLNFGAAWKGIDFSIFFQGVAGNDIYDATRRTDLKSVNLPAYMLDRWTGAGTSNEIPRLALDDPNGNWLSSDLYVQNGSYLRLRNIQLGYTFPSKWMTKAKVQRLRLYVAAENLLTITGYRGFDPEISSGGTSLGVDRGVYPQPRTITFGANLSF